MARVEHYGNYTPVKERAAITRSNCVMHWKPEPNTRGIQVIESDYTVEVLISTAKRRAKTHVTVRYAWNSYTNSHSADTRGAANEFIAKLNAAGLTITEFESKCNSETEKGAYTQSGSPCNEAYADTISLALYFQARRINLTVK